MPSVTSYEITKAVGVEIERLRQKWFSSPRMQQPIDVTGTAVIHCRITRDGKTDKLKVVQSSGDPSLDAAAAALLSDASFAGLPAGFKGTELRAFFPFNLPSASDRPACSSLAITHTRKVGRGVSPPHAIYQPDPEYSDQARRSKYQGQMLLGLTVTSEGTASDVCVLQGLGMALDERAMEAVKTWRFMPSLENGAPVPVRIAVEVTFHLY
jgi:TonB family protein